MIATSVAILKTGVFGRWLGWLGLVMSLPILIAIGLVIGQFAIPALLVWAIALGVALWRTPAVR
jgi:hypothetical protein